MYHGEKFNSITHLVALMLSISGVSVLMTFAGQTHDIWKIVSCAIYGAMTIFLYGFSTLYHSLRGPSKKFFQKLDYIAIYLMIAGSYTPFTLVTLRESGTSGWWLFSLIWGLAILGISQEVFRKSHRRRLSLIIYLVMGWLVLGALKQIWSLLPFWAIFWLVAGGVFYTVGVLFFIFDEKWKHAHGIWHLFVVAGSTCQYFCVLVFVI